jgi:hypothetical protein
LAGTSIEPLVPFHVDQADTFARLEYGPRCKVTIEASKSVHHMLTVVFNQLRGCRDWDIDSTDTICVVCIGEARGGCLHALKHGLWLHYAARGKV